MEFPQHFHAAMDTRRWGLGEWIVFEPYTRDVFSQSFDWIAKHEIFQPGSRSSGELDKAIVPVGLADAEIAKARQLLAIAP